MGPLTKVIPLGLFLAGCPIVPNSSADITSALRGCFRGGSVCFVSFRLKAKENLQRCGDVFFVILITSKRASAFFMFLVIFQKRVRVFHRCFKHEKTDESTKPQAEGFYCFRVFETPMKHEARVFEITGAYHLARKSGNFGLKSNGKVIFRKFHSEIVEYLQRYSSFSVRNGTAEISLPFAKLSSFQSLISQKQ